MKFNVTESLFIALIKTLKNPCLKSIVKKILKLWNQYQNYHEHRVLKASKIYLIFNL